MKFLIGFVSLCLTAVAIVFICHSPAKPDLPQGKSERGIVTVSASHSENYSPTSMAIALSLNSRSQDKAALIELSKTRLEELTEFASTLNIPSDSIVATQFSLDKTWTWEKHKRVPTGFEIAQRISVKLPDPEKLSTFIEGIATISDIEIKGTAPILADSLEKQNDVYKAAVEEATAKAEALAKASHKELGKLIFLSDGSDKSYSYEYDALDDVQYDIADAVYKLGRTSAPMPVQKLQLSAKVVMKFKLK